MLFSPSVVLGLLQGFFFLRIGVAFRDIAMLTVARSSLIIVSVVFLVHLHPPPPPAPPTAVAPTTQTHILAYASLSSHKPQFFAMLMQIKVSGRKHVEISEAAMLKLERENYSSEEENR